MEVKKGGGGKNRNNIPTHVPHGCLRKFLLLTRSRQTLVHELFLYKAHPPLQGKGGRERDIL